MSPLPVCLRPSVYPERPALYYLFIFCTADFRQGLSTRPSLFENKPLIDDKVSNILHIATRPDIKTTGVIRGRTCPQTPRAGLVGCANPTEHLSGVTAGWWGESDETIYH